MVIGWVIEIQDWNMYVLRRQHYAKQYYIVKQALPDIGFPEMSRSDPSILSNSLTLISPLPCPFTWTIQLLLPLFVNVHSPTVGL